MIPRGDDFTDEQIAAWFADEERGHFNLHVSSQERPEYDAINESTLFQHVRDHHYGTCLALGAAKGLDIAPFARNVDRFLVIEPAVEYWREAIGGKPAEYRRPTLRAKIDIEPDSVDIATAICVLHHIPNVTDVLTEMHRVLRRGAPLLIREPMSSMGDWTKPRQGVTKNERGLPADWLVGRLQRIGFDIQRITPSDFRPLARVCQRLGIIVGQEPVATRVDLLLSRLFAWNSQYERFTLRQKIAPGSIAVIARKR